MKFEYYYRELKKVKDPNESILKALNKYSAICREALISCNLIPGVETFLAKLRDENIRCFVVSGGNQQELRKVFLAKGLRGYFDDVMGSPRSKNEILQSLVKELESPVVYFGDAFLDCQAAIQNNMDFVFISGRSDWAEGHVLCKSLSLPVYRDFLEILSEDEDGITNKMSLM